MEKHYSMPQKFIDDPNVALRWKVYALLNGFWLNGKTVYATNEWIAKQLDKPERSVQRALSELEELGLCTRDIKGMKRLILPGGLKGCHSVTWGDVTGRRAEHVTQRHHNSDSNSDNKKGPDGHFKENDDGTTTDGGNYTRGDLSDFSEYTDRKEKKGIKKSDPTARELVKKFQELRYKHIGYPIEKVTPRDIAVVKRAMDNHNIHKHDVERLFEEWFDNPTRPDDDLVHITKALSAHNITNFKLYE